MGRLDMSKLTVVGVIALCVGLAACDDRPRKTVTKTVAVEKPCDCTRETAVEDDYYPEPPRTVRHRAKTHKVYKSHKKHYAKKRHHHYAAQDRRDEFYAGGYQGEAAEIQGRSFSRSSSSYSEEHRYYKEDERTPMRHDRRYKGGYERSHEASGRWVDGYGRVHYASGSYGQTGPMVINSRQGRSTWHGYGVYCDDTSHGHGPGYHHHDHSKAGHHFD